MGFTPKGAQPLWQPLFDLLAAGEVGDVLTYERLEEVAADVRTNRSPLYQAVRHLESDRKRTVECVHKVGYRIVDAPEHARLARTHQKRSLRQIKRSRRKLDSADPARLTPAQAAEFAEWSARLGQMESMVRRVHRRLVLVEEKVASTQIGQAQMQATLASVVETLRQAGLMREEKAA